ncbi:hypothetical protein FDA94_17235 [Herbidospora galbida]|uniref:Uncharacterized protein n=1 Tax=Herbidospora galbida TaxID=2575442 RepID=A0A4U3MDY7_9ACTN|nr:DUF6119 family protein [Herbidospora galbida]TKK87568.1 hypothetical protein FDA94_17235 [Herbidospora galbida]
MSRCRPLLPRAELDARLDARIDARIDGDAVRWSVVVPSACRAAHARADRFRVKVGSVSGYRDTVDVAYVLQRALLQPAGERVAALRSGIIRMYAGSKDIGGARVPAWLQAVMDDRWALVDGEWRELDPDRLAGALARIRPLFGADPGLPAWHPGESPRVYAANAGNLRPDLLALPGGELGDLLTARGDLMYVTTVAGLGHVATAVATAARSRFAGGTRPLRVVFVVLSVTPVPPERLFPLVRLSLADAARTLGDLGVGVEVVIHRP